MIDGGGSTNKPAAGSRWLGKEEKENAALEEGGGEGACPGRV